MSKRKKKNRINKSPAPDTKPPEEKKASPLVSFYGFRELVESVAIAFILAFLFRTFEAEAFVIPTGSMATTLMGRHKDFVCDKCGYSFQVSASEEIDSRTGRATGREVIGGVCPMCRHPMQLSRGSLEKKDNRSFSGDRIIVGKFLYDIEEPRRWDVSVFKFPAESKTNYIKRLVGLPNETLRISHGDLFVKPEAAAEFVIARKPPDKLRAMLQPVYDNDYVLPGMLEKGWPSRWQGRPGLAGQAGPADKTVPTGKGDSTGWTASDDHREFTISGKQTGPVWLQYRHFIPNPSDWLELGKGPLPKGYAIKPQLITDFSSYNAGIWRDLRHGEASNGLRGYGKHWVGDLAVECDVDVQNDRGKVLLKLVEGGRDMLAAIDVASGEAVLSISGDTFQRRGRTPIRKPGTYTLLFANVDDQLRLWVDDELIAFDKPTTYPPLGNRRPQAADLAPVAIGSEGVRMRVSHLRVLRDIYYIADKDGNGMGVSDYKSPYRVFGGHMPYHMVEFFSDPSRWDVLDSELMRSVEFNLADDQFLMLGDNSAMSRDSRLWNPEEFYVDRDLMIGKALYIYWPHSWDKLPGTDIPFPFFPNFKKMQLIR